MGADGPLPDLEPAVRVGVDLAAVGDVEHALAHLGERYLRRLFTEHEREACQGPDGPRAESLAARFAAKEAVVKVLRPADWRPPWRDIEVRRRPDGSCSVRLHGSAAELAAAQGIGALSLSMSHEGPMAVAVVAAACETTAAPS